MLGTTYNAIDYANIVIYNIIKYGHTHYCNARHIAEAKFITGF